MPIDSSIPLGVNVPVSDPSKAMNTLENFQRSILLGQQSQLAQNKMNALRDFGEAFKSGDEERIAKSIEGVSSIDPDAGRTLSATHQSQRQIKAQDESARTGDISHLDAFPEAKHIVTQTLATKSATENARALARMDAMGRHAEAYQSGNRSPEAWDMMLDNAHKTGLFQPGELNKFRGKPNDMQAEMWKAAGMHAREHMEATGETGANQPANLGPETTRYSPYDAKRTPTPTSKDTKGDKLSDIPKVDLEEPAQPGEIRRGQNPAVLEAKKTANDNYAKVIAPEANSAAKQRAELGVIRSQLEKGGLQTGATAGIRETTSAYMYEAARLAGLSEGAAAEQVSKVTGINPTDAAVFNKSSVRLGFDMAREQGAREAVQVIQYALNANPNLLQTKDGALQMAKILDSTAKWKIDRQGFADQYLQKNKHLVGFENWHNESHPLQVETSKVIPYQIPTNPSELQSGVTYSGKTKDGKEFTGTWNPKTQSFD